MLPQVNLQIGPCIVLLITALDMAWILVYVQMSLLVVSQNPCQYESRIATLVAAYEFSHVLLVMYRFMAI